MQRCIKQSMDCMTPCHDIFTQLMYSHELVRSVVVTCMHPSGLYPAVFGAGIALCSQMHLRKHISARLYCMICSAAKNYVQDEGGAGRCCARSCCRVALVAGGRGMEAFQAAGP